MMSIKKIFSDTSWSLMNQIIERGVLSISSILIARHFGTTDYALYSFFYLTANMLSSYASMGLSVTSTRIFATVEKNNPNPLIGAIIALSFGSAIIFSSLIVINFEKINLNAKNPQVFVYLSVYVFVSVIFSIFKGAVFGLGKFKDFFKVSLFASMSLMCLVGYSIWAKKIEYSIYGFIVHSLMLAIGSIYLTAKIVGFSSIMKSLSFSYPHVLKILSFSGPMFLTSLIVSTGIWALGVLLINSNNGEYKFAMFSIGLQLISIGILLPTQLSNVLVPILIRMAQKDNLFDINRKKKLVKKMLTTTILLSLSTIFLGLIFSDIVNQLYGHKYNITKEFIMLFLVASMFNSTSTIMCNALLAHDKPWKWLQLNIIWFFSLIGSAYLMKNNPNSFGAIALIIANFLLFITSFVFAVKSRYV